MSTKRYLCFLLSPGDAARAVYAGAVSGCEVHVAPNQRCSFYVQASNDAGVSPPSLHSSPIVARPPPLDDDVDADTAAAADGDGVGGAGGDVAAAATSAELLRIEAEARRAEAKRRLRSATAGVGGAPGGISALRQAIKAARVAGVNEALLDKARRALQEAHNAAERHVQLADKLRAMLQLPLPRVQAASLSATIALAAGVGLSADLLAEARARLGE